MNIYLVSVVLVALIGYSRADYDCTVVPGNGTVDIDACSQFPVFIDGAVMTKCNNDFPNTGDLPIGVCTAQCLLNATNVIVNATAKVNQTLFTNLINATSVGDWTDVAAAALDTCYSLLATQEETINGMITSSSTPFCHPQSAVLISCLYTQLFINTPDSVFNPNANSVCPDLKDFVRQCATN